MIDTAYRAPECEVTASLSASWTRSTVGLSVSLRLRSGTPTARFPSNLITSTRALGASARLSYGLMLVRAAARYWRFLALLMTVIGTLICIV